MKNPIVATYFPETSPQLVLLFPFIYKIENKICHRKPFPDVCTVLCSTISLWCPHKWLVIYKITLLNVSKNNKIQYWLINDHEVATSEISVLGSGVEEIAKMEVLNINITNNKIIRKLEKTYLPICRI